MKPAPFEYRRAISLDNALELLEEGGPDAKPLAGGQSLVPLLNMRFLRPSLLVDLNGIEGLDRIESTDGAVRVGALVRQGALGGSSLVRERCPLLAECVPLIGHFVTRNRGTVGGSIAHADGGAELPIALVTLGGTVVAQSRFGCRRELPAEKFFITHFTTALEPGELVTHTIWPGAARSWGYAFEELAQRHGDFALSIAACALHVVDDRIAELRLCLGAVTERPMLVEVPLTGRPVDEAARAAAAAARAAVEPFGSMHASAEYLRHITGVLTERAVLRAWRNATEVAT